VTNDPHHHNTSKKPEGNGRSHRPLSARARFFFIDDKARADAQARHQKQLSIHLQQPAGNASASLAEFPLTPGRMKGYELNFIPLMR